MNKSSVFALISLLLIIIAKPVYAQSQRPKIGLVLSGGGAKGIAHVRILQVLDSLGIVPDYIAGTSMGSVVGALYASGYSAHQIDSITQAIHWTSLFLIQFLLTKSILKRRMNSVVTFMSFR
ncbi:MAG: patatin-like phospholipase family protein [Flammeovirgaceae bacterium]|nr:patatin-like phospholipase family protein [Flammeovirgaceae bacterium]